MGRKRGLCLWYLDSKLFNVSSMLDIKQVR